MTTFSVFSFGCRVNQAEMENLERQMLAKGFVQNQENPDLFIINTCAVTHKAEREARQMIYKIKNQNAKIKIIITGCAATNWLKDKKTKNIPADYFVDNVNKEYLAELLQKWTKDINKKNITNIAKQNSKFISSGRFLVKIQDGCHRFCTFCIVPYLRGLPKSIPSKEIIKSIKNHEKQIKEVILTAINTEAYGRDSDESFYSLIEKVLNETKVPRLSFGSIHPWSINEEFFRLYGKILPQKRLVDFFHIPLQSGSNKILLLMKRGCTREEFKEKLKTLEKINPLAFMATDVIVGFLEETDKDFEDTYEFLKESPINKFHVFRFSKRTKTAAYFMSKRNKEPDEKIKKQRARALIDLGKEKYQKFLEKHVGKTFSCLFLEERVDEMQKGLLSNQIPVLVKTPKNLKAQIKNVKVEKIKKEILSGKVV